MMNNRYFYKTVILFAVAVLVFAGCSKDDDPVQESNHYSIMTADFPIHNAYFEYVEREKIYQIVFISDRAWDEPRNNQMPMYYASLIFSDNLLNTTVDFSNPPKTIGKYHLLYNVNSNYNGLFAGDETANENIGFMGVNSPSGTFHVKRLDNDIFEVSITVSGDAPYRLHYKGKITNGIPSRQV